MPRKGPASRREIDPDPIYQNQLVTQLINKVLLSGKRGLSGGGSGATGRRLRGGRPRL